ncbi:MAG: SpoIIE family protein phosphatase, partial [Coraliomargarita sp.]|nr:SpoIIE family protein phosphatase [Coraliomargarita sp.]
VYSESKIELNSGDELLLYTDGIIEAAIGDDEYSEDRLVQFLTAHRRKKLPEMMESLLKSVQEFTHSEELQDDVCLVGLRLP